MNHTLKMLSRTTIAALLGSLAFAVMAADPPSKVLKKVPPEFPAEAVRASVTGGSIKAKMTIGADGTVTNVDIIDAEPKRVFDKAARQALMDWRFEPSGSKQTYEVKLIFSNAD